MGGLIFDWRTLVQNCERQADQMTAGLGIVRVFQHWALELGLTVAAAEAAS